MQWSNQRNPTGCELYQQYVYAKNTSEMRISVKGEILAILYNLYTCYRMTRISWCCRCSERKAWVLQRYLVWCWHDRHIDWEQCVLLLKYKCKYNFHSPFEGIFPLDFWTREEIKTDRFFHSECDIGMASRQIDQPSSVWSTGHES